MDKNKVIINTMKMLIKSQKIEQKEICGDLEPSCGSITCDDCLLSTNTLQKFEREGGFDNLLTKGACVDG